MTNTELANASNVILGTTEASAVYIGNTLMWQKTQQPQLPYDAEIEYLESSGTQYIDTNIFINSTDFEIGYTVNGYGSWGWVHQNDANGTWITITNNSSSNYCKWWYGNYNRSGTGSFQSGFYTVIYKFREGLDLNGYNISFSGSMGRDNISNTSLRFFMRYDFRQNRMEPNVPGSKFKSFYVKIDGVLVRDFISVRVGQVGYMYDKVSGQLFGNSGTGDFTLGPDKQ